MIQAFEQGHVQIATQIHLKLLPLFKALFITTNPIPVKAALRLQGWQVGGLRLPLNDESAVAEPQLKAAMAELGLLQPL
jgi:4-hydroxy-tetrahydrodipicolinate synthase